MSRILEIEAAQTGDDVKTSQSVAANQYSTIEKLDAKVEAMKKISTITSFKKKSSSKSKKPKKLTEFFEDENRIHDLRIFPYDRY